MRPADDGALGRSTCARPPARGGSALRGRRRRRRAGQGDAVEGGLPRRAELLEDIAEPGSAGRRALALSAATPARSSTARCETTSRSGCCPRWVTNGIRVALNPTSAFAAKQLGLPLERDQLLPTPPGRGHLAVGRVALLLHMPIPDIGDGGPAGSHSSSRDRPTPDPPRRRHHRCPSDGSPAPRAHARVRLPTWAHSLPRGLPPPCGGETWASYLSPQPFESQSTRSSSLRTRTDKANMRAARSRRVPSIVGIGWIGIVGATRSWTVVHDAMTAIHLFVDPLSIVLHPLGRWRRRIGFVPVRAYLLGIGDTRSSIPSPMTTVLRAGAVAAVATPP